MTSKKQKFVPVTGKTSNTFILPGRQKCECAASKHDLINNCINCGRIICAQEGSGPCWFCGSLVCTDKENIFIKSNSNNAKDAMQKLMKNTWPHHKDIAANNISTNCNEKNNNESKEAEERKVRLLEFDRNSTRRTKVIDDQNDYYRSEGTSWIDPKKKELLKKKENELRAERFAPAYTKSMKYSLDLSKGGLVREADDSIQAAYALFEDPDADINSTIPFEEVQRESSVNADFLTYIESDQKRKAPAAVQDKKEPSERQINRLQDRELQEIRDEGLCLSLHQPWASLLVAGVKTAEGRSWFSNHRGRLWIAATAKVPSPEDIRDTERFYVARGVPRDRLPTSHPVGCLLGCVDVADCLPADDYKQMHPDGESDSPFVFLCENARELAFKFPIKGKHKIYKLEGHVHAAARGAILRQL